MPSVLGGGARLEESGGAAKGVGCGGVIAMVGGFPIAGEGRVFRGFEVTLCPTVGDMGAKVGTARVGGSGNGCKWCRRSSGGFGGGESTRSGGCIGAVVTGTAGGGGESPVLVGGAELGDQVCEGFVGIGFCAPSTKQIPVCI